MQLNIVNLGQVFTPFHIVSGMISMMKNKGNILEPSAGDGAFSKNFPKEKIIAIEYDKKLAQKNNFFNIDFFNYSIRNKFDTVIGNPPYVRYQDINKDTKKLVSTYKIFDHRSNLYLFFIYKSILHLKENGELIFITPRDFLKSTSSINLNNFIYQNGTITDIIELGDKKVFKNASPNTAIWRFEKNNFKRITSLKKKFVVNAGQIFFTKKEYSVYFKDIAFVKVGAVSGKDKYFENEDGIDFVCSYTNKTQKIKRMIYNQYHPDLEIHKENLLNRKIKKFTQKDWYMWGRNCYESDKNRIYVNCKTRNKKPFFMHDIKHYDGSVMAVFLKGNDSYEKLEKFCKMLNHVHWYELGFVVDGRFIFSQKSLENTLLPQEFHCFLNNSLNKVQYLQPNPLFH